MTLYLTGTRLWCESTTVEIVNQSWKENHLDLEINRRNIEGRRALCLEIQYVQCSCIVTLFSVEANFYLHGSVNKQNVKYRAETNVVWCMNYSCIHVG